MSVLKSISIRNDKDKRLIHLFFPDQQHLYWDVYTVNKDQLQNVYYQMHLTTVLDMIYRAGVQGYEVKLNYIGGDDVEL